MNLTRLKHPVDVSALRLQLQAARSEIENEIAWAPRDQDLALHELLTEVQSACEIVIDYLNTDGKPAERPRTLNYEP